MFPKVSIIIPVFNVEPYIQDCLNSVIRQDYQGEIECIIVNDCTPDGSMDVVDKFLKNYSGNISFRLVNLDRNRGLSYARNIGLEHTTGKYVYFLDSDDEITSDCLSILTAPLLTSSYNMVLADYSLVGTDSMKKQLFLEEGSYFNREIAISKIKGLWYPMAVNKLYDVTFLRNNSLTFCNGLIHEDELWSVEIACLAQSMYVIRSSTYIYKVRDGSITTANLETKRERMHNAFFTMLASFYLFMSQHSLTSDYYANTFLQILFNYVIRFSPDISSFYKSYMKCRSIIPAGFKYLFLNQFSLRKQIRDFHFIFPPVLGYYIYKYLNIKLYNALDKRE